MEGDDDGGGVNMKETKIYPISALVRLLQNPSQYPAEA